MLKLSSLIEAQGVQETATSKPLDLLRNMKVLAGFNPGEGAGGHLLPQESQLPPQTI